jgi:hypothetical protein
MLKNNKYPELAVVEIDAQLLPLSVTDVKRHGG